MNILLRRTALPALGTLLLLSGCASAAAGPAAAGAPTAERGTRYLITREEITSTGAPNLYEVVQRLRPQWLRAGAATSIRGAGATPVVVYQDNTRLGGVETLRQLTPGFASALRFLDGPEASNTLPGLGSRSVAGAIVVMTPGAR